MQVAMVMYNGRLNVTLPDLKEGFTRTFLHKSIGGTDTVSSWTRSLLLWRNSASNVQHLMIIYLLEYYFTSIFRSCHGSQS
jgi:hypothetical protein